MAGQKLAAPSMLKPQKTGENGRNLHKKASKLKFNESVNQIMQTSLVSGCLGQNHHSLKKNRKETAHTTQLHKIRKKPKMKWKESIS